MSGGRRRRRSYREPGWNGFLRPDCLITKVCSCCSLGNPQAYGSTSGGVMASRDPRESGLRLGPKGQSLGWPWRPEFMDENPAAATDSPSQNHPFPVVWKAAVTRSHCPTPPLPVLLLAHLGPSLDLLETHQVLSHPRALALTVSPAESSLSQVPSHPSHQSSYGTSENKSLPLLFLLKHHCAHNLNFLALLASYCHL